MEGKQLARLLPYGLNGEKLPDYIPANSKTKEFYPGSYPKIMPMLKRMEEAGELKKHRDYGGESYVWMLSRTSLKPSGNWYNRKHELACGDVFVAYQNAGVVDHWDNKWTSEEVAFYDIIKKMKVYYDRRMVAYNNVFFWEIDRGTEDGDKLEEKIDKYMAFSRRFPKEFFYVLFAMQGSRYYKLDSRIQWMLKMLEARRTPGYQFLVGSHDAILADPTGPVFRTYRTEEPLALSDLRSA